MSSAGDSTGKKKGKPRGKPFPPGQLPPVGHPPWPKGGPSPNPGGRPASEPRFRERCREVAETLLEKLAHVDPTVTSGPDGGMRQDIAGLVAAFQAVSDRGGYVTTDKLDSADASKAKLVLAAMALQQLTPDQRDRLIAQVLGKAPATVGAAPVQAALDAGDADE